MLLGFSCSQSCPMAREVLAQGIGLWFDFGIPFMALHHQLLPLMRPNIFMRPRKALSSSGQRRKMGFAFPLAHWKQSGKSWEGSGCQHHQGPGEFGPLGATPALSKCSTRKHSLALQETAAPAFYLRLFATPTSPSGEAPASFY